MSGKSEHVSIWRQEAPSGLSLLGMRVTEPWLREQMMSGGRGLANGAGSMGWSVDSRFDSSGCKAVRKTSRELTAPSSYVTLRATSRFLARRTVTQDGRSLLFAPLAPALGNGPCLLFPLCFDHFVLVLSPARLQGQPSASRRPSCGLPLGPALLSSPPQRPQLAPRSWLL